MEKKRFWLSTITAWLLFVGIDFLFHASILQNIWKEITAAKPLEELALLIPVGYTGFLLLTILIGYLFVNIYKEKLQLKEVVKFGIIFGGLYSLSSFLGSFSFINIPIFFLTLINIVNFIEIFGVVIVYNNLLYGNRFRRKTGIIISVFIILLIFGIIIQNI
ncbi:MAG: hypothetical protein JSW73_03835 [Candidatus Woesearchaeota archaeon]|nr:MAG: hypothetical protein JSW73_03835 [Candidatus Woesearchaeota archaeon]